MEMSFKVNTDIVLAFESLRIRCFRKQGLLRFRVTLFQTARKPFPLKNVKNNFIADEVCCSPYNIYNKNHEANLEALQRQGLQKEQSSNLRISQEAKVYNFAPARQQVYYSKIVQSKFNSQNHRIEQFCFFRTYVDVQKMDNTQFKLKVELLFAPEGQLTFIEAGFYEGIVHRINGVGTFLPIVFDEFGGFTVVGTYQSTIMEYRFEESQQTEGFENFGSYISAATQGLRRQQLRRFYEYYRRSLQSELSSIQERHSTLMKWLSMPLNLSCTKVGVNQKLYHMIEDLNNGGGFLRQRNQEPLGLEQMKQLIGQEINRDFFNFKALIYQKWNEYILFLADHIELVTAHYKSIYEANVKQRLKNHIFSHQIEEKFDWTYSRYEDSGKVLLSQAKLDNSKDNQQELWSDIFPIQNKNFFEAAGKNIKIFQEIYPVSSSKKNVPQPTAPTTRRNSYDTHCFSTYSLIREGSSLRLSQVQEQQQREAQKQKVQEERKMLSEHSKIGIPLQMAHQSGKVHTQGAEHIIIFVHGYQASRQDFFLFKSCLEVKYKCRVFISSANQGKTEETIENLGKRLAVQLNNFFKTIDFGPLTRLSFIGHSMGGIIIRCALDYIKNIDQYLYTYMSFSSPHLGYLYEPSAIVQAGLWLLNTWQKSESVQELCMKDGINQRKSFLYRLSQSKTLNGFKKLAFLSSSQDEYVPYESARIQKNNLLLKKLGNETSANLIKEMVDNILGEVGSCQISRINVVFNIEDKNLDSMIGRTAHVKYLSDQKFIKLFCSIFDKFLQ